MDQNTLGGTRLARIHPRPGALSKAHITSRFKRRNSEHSVYPPPPSPSRGPFSNSWVLVNDKESVTCKFYILTDQ